MRLQVFLFSAVAIHGGVLAAKEIKAPITIPQECSKVCTSTQTVTVQCKENPELGAECLCKQKVITDMHDCLQCAVDNAEDGQGDAVEKAQSTIDDLIQECEKSSITLTPIPITAATASVALTTTGSDALTMDETMSMPTSTSAPTTAGPASAAAASGTPTSGAASGAIGKAYGGMATVGGGVLAFALTLFTLL